MMRVIIQFILQLFESIGIDVLGVVSAKKLIYWEYFWWSVFFIGKVTHMCYNEISNHWGGGMFLRETCKGCQIQLHCIPFRPHLCHLYVDVTIILQ